MIEASPGWWIPLSWTGQDNPDFADTSPKHWVSPTMKEFLLSGLPPKRYWTVFNIQQSSFYRINYDIENWLALGEQLRADHTVIHSLNRAQIIDDSFQLAKAGKLTIYFYMETIKTNNKNIKVEL